MSIIQFVEFHVISYAYIPTVGIISINDNTHSFFFLEDYKIKKSEREEGE